MSIVQTIKDQPILLIVVSCLLCWVIRTVASMSCPPEAQVTCMTGVSIVNCGICIYVLTRLLKSRK